MPEFTRRHRAALAIFAWGAGCLLYRVLVNHRLEQTGVLFIGIPTFLAICIALAPKSTTYTGTILKTITLFLLLSGPVLQEGFICVLMASPLFYLIGAAAGWVADHSPNRRSRIVRCLPLILLSSEGADPRLSFPRMEAVEGRLVVPESPETVREHMNQVPPFADPRPAFLRLGFPQPVSADGEGRSVGSLRQIHFAGGEGQPGTLVWKVAESQPDRVVFACASDTTHIAHWLAWQSAEVEWRPLASGQTELHWKVRYRRLLDPYWYFAPWERYAVKLAGSYYAAALQ